MTDPESEYTAPQTSAARENEEASEVVLIKRAESVEQVRQISRRQFTRFLVLLRRTFRKHIPQVSPKEPAPQAFPPPMAGNLKRWLPALQVFPWILAVGFAVSFFWDFTGYPTVEGLLRILTVSGLVSFATNWLAITMLFQPRRKRVILPQGLIPAQRDRVIFRLSQSISRELINEQIIREKIESSGIIPRYREKATEIVRHVLEDEEFRTELKTFTADYLESTLGSESMRRQLASYLIERIQQSVGGGIAGIALKTYRLFGEDDFQRRIGDAVKQIPSSLDPWLDKLDTVLDDLPEFVDTQSLELEDLVTRTVLDLVARFDVQAMIVERAQQFDEKRLEDLLKNTSNEQLNYIKYLGAVLGVIGGTIIWQPLWALLALIALGLAIWGLDEWLIRRKSDEWLG